MLIQGVSIEDERATHEMRKTLIKQKSHLVCGRCNTLSSTKAVGERQRLPNVFVLKLRIFPFEVRS
jgi:hypothetical protein